MAGPKDVTIRVQALDGTWQTMGGETARGLYPENVSLEADSWGSSGASFNLRRDPRAFFPDISAFTPVEIDVGSSLVWSGRVRETPSQVAQRVISVQCEGWQYHLDDDIYQRTYVHTNLSEWKDARIFLDANLSRATQSGQVSSDGSLTIGFSKGAQVPAGNAFVGVVLDLGPNATAARGSFTWESSNNDGNFVVVFRGMNTPNPESNISEDLASFNMVSGASGTSSNNFVTARRYLTIAMFGPVGALTVANDVWLKIRDISVFGEVGYASGAVSDLRASTVVADALSRATLLLSSDLSGVQTTSFVIPSYTPGYQTPRQAWTAVDSYHDWFKQIDVRKRPIYTAKPTRPVFEVGGAHSALNDDDASANSGAEIYNQAVVTASAPDGSAVVVSQPQALSAQIPFTSGVAGVSGPVTGFALGFPLDVTFKKGVTYALRVQKLVVSSFVSAGTLTGATVGSGSDFVAYPDIPIPSAGTFGPFAWVLWTPATDITTSFGYSSTVSGNQRLDFTVQAVWGNTLPERRGFRRTMQLPVSSILSADGVAHGKIGDVWLADHKTTPFRGAITLIGDESLREITTGRDVGLEQLLLNTGQLLRFSDRSDPDTGGHGRDGRIVAVSYSPAANTAQITIDNSRTSFDALLSRLAVIQGG